MRCSPPPTSVTVCSPGAVALPCIGSASRQASTTSARRQEVTLRKDRSGASRRRVRTAKAGRAPDTCTGPPPRVAHLPCASGEEGRRMANQRLSELEGVIGEVTASYREGRLIDSLSSAQLPNRRQVIEALGHLKAVMYLGYYATGALDESKLHYTVASHLYPAYEILVEQIRRATNYEGFRTAGASRDPGWPETVTLDLLR